jgi:hypothetical protein
MSVLLALMVLLVGCSSIPVGPLVNSLAKIPFVDRTEWEINNWFNNRPIIDDKPMTSGAAINGDPKVLLINQGPGLMVKGTSYPSTICITQRNTLPGGQIALYAARVGIEVLNNPNLFECGKIELGSCDGDPMEANVAFGRPQSILEKAFRDAMNQWLQEDIVKTLKSTTNKEGFANPANAQPRDSAKVRGVLYNVTEDKGPPVVRSIGFIAE